MKDEDMLENQLQREDYWADTLHNICPYCLNEKTKSMHKDLPLARLFAVLPQYMKNFSLKQEPMKNKYILFNHKLCLVIYTNFPINLAVMNVTVS